MGLVALSFIVFDFIFSKAGTCTIVANHDVICPTFPYSLAKHVRSTVLSVLTNFLLFMFLLQAMLTGNMFPFIGQLVCIAFIQHFDTDTQWGGYFYVIAESYIFVCGLFASFMYLHLVPSPV